MVNGDSVNVYFTLSSKQCHCVHKCNTIGLSSFCIAPLSVPKVEVGRRAAVPIVELGEQRVNIKVVCGKPSSVHHIDPIFITAL